jgi:CBS domain containing-hemolysin-like protein
MLEIKRGFLKKGESLSCHGISFTVLSIAGRRIEKVKVRTDESVA